MFLWKKVNLTEQKNRISDDITKWSNTNERFLNLISVPYNSSEILVKIIEKYAKDNKKIIYITNELPEEVDIIANIKRHSNFRDYAYIRNPKNDLHCKLKICNFQNSIILSERFDLVIYDDIREFPSHNNHEILDIINKVSTENSKVILYSVESMLKDKREIILPVKDNRTPIVEPRTILTRIDINKDIPFVIYDYLTWSINSGKKVIICVPDEYKVENVYSYISQYCKDFSKNIICFTKNKSDKKLISKFLKMKKVILITNCFDQMLSNAKDCDIMVYFADHPIFNYKKFIYLCGSVGRSEKYSKGEVIFLANEETVDMEKAKDITMNFNKEAWDMGLLKV